MIATRPLTAIVAYALLALPVVACDGGLPTEPSESVSTVNLTFSSTVQRLGLATRSFETNGPGQIGVTLTALGQEGASVRIGLGLHVPVTGACAVTFDHVTPVSSTAQLSASAHAGAYCVMIADIGELTGPTTFTVTISHP